MVGMLSKITSQQFYEFKQLEIASKCSCVPAVQSGPELHKINKHIGLNIS
jgi:hypothetical protein